MGDIYHPSTIMPLYELVCLAQHYPMQYAPLRGLVAQTAAFINLNGGPVRRLDSFGNQTLPGTIRKEGLRHTSADYWTMHFDTNPAVLKQLATRMKDDPRVLRWTALKKGVTLDEVVSPSSVLDATLKYPTASTSDVLKQFENDARTVASRARQARVANESGGNKGGRGTRAQSHQQRNQGSSSSHRSPRGTPSFAARGRAEREQQQSGQGMRGQGRF